MASDTFVPFTANFSSTLQTVQFEQAKTLLALENVLLWQLLQALLCVPFPAKEIYSPLWQSDQSMHSTEAVECV
jgi:hypothetical protein